MHTHTLKTLLFLILIFTSAGSNAALMFDQNINPDVIFGSGNANGGWTVDSQNGVELGLRAKLRFDNTNQPQNIFNSNGDGTYSYDNTAPPVGFSFAPGSSSTAIWNFEWSVNVEGTGLNLDDLTYRIEIDFDEAASMLFLGFDPVNQPSADNALGTNATGNGMGVVDIVNYATLLGSNTVAQNSWNMEFFDSMTYQYNNTDVGIFDIRLSAYDGATLLASTNIQVLQGSIPEPGSLALLLTGVAFLFRKKLTAG